MATEELDGGLVHRAPHQEEEGQEGEEGHRLNADFSYFCFPGPQKAAQLLEDFSEGLLCTTF